MDLRQLAALVAVAEHRLFSAAARRLHTVQSNVSTHVARLERELGVTLVDRTTGRSPRRARSWSTGPAASGRARGARGRRRLDAPRGLRLGPARLHRHGQPLAASPASSASWPSATRKVHVVVVDATTTSLVPQLRRRAASTWPSSTCPCADAELDTEPLFDEERIVLAPHGHPLAARRPRRPRRAGRARAAARAPGTAFRDELDDEAARSASSSGPRPRSTACACWPRWPSRASAPPSSRPPPRRRGYEATCRRVAVDGLPARSVGLATPRRGRLSAPARAVREPRSTSVVASAQDGVHLTLGVAGTGGR